MSTTLHLSAPRPATTRKGSARATASPAAAPVTAARRPDLERQSITFTIGLYLFICTALLGTHLAASGTADADPTAPGTSPTAVTTTAPSGATSSGQLATPDLAVAP
ncbi:hypothetical protein [Oerskovia turbata]